jgi:hypothetical protein
MSFSAAVLLLALLSVISAAPTPTNPLPPSRDPFYTAPDGFEHATPGEVLRVRTAPGNLTTLVANTSQAYHVLYRTTDSRYHASWAVTTLFLPLSNSTSDALLSYQIPYNSPNIDESPSWAYYAGQNSWNSDQFIDVEWALGRGWFVNVPDFEGPLAAFIAGPQEGHAILDSIRAVKSLSFGLAPEARVALWGYSGGSLASEFAAEMQVQYAPELQISGIARQCDRCSRPRQRSAVSRADLCWTTRLDGTVSRSPGIHCRPTNRQRALQQDYIPSKPQVPTDRGIRNLRESDNVELLPRRQRHSLQPSFVSATSHRNHTGLARCPAGSAVHLQGYS